MQALFNLKGVAWCAIFASVCGGDIWSARAIDFAPAKRRVTIQTVILGLYTPKAGDWLVKERVGGNHVDILIVYEGGRVEVIGGNVGDKVTKRVMDILAYKYVTPN